MEVDHGPAAAGIGGMSCIVPSSHNITTPYGALCWLCTHFTGVDKLSLESLCTAKVKLFSFTVKISEDFMVNYTININQKYVDLTFNHKVYKETANT